MSGNNHEIKSVLLVGGSGFLGVHLIQAFWDLTPRPEIHVFDIRPLGYISPKFYTFNPEKIKVHIGDLTSHDDVTAAIDSAQPSVVVHSASPVHGMGAQLYQKVNVEGTKVLIECIEKAQSIVKAFVLTSSSGVIFNGHDLYGADETYPYPIKHMDAYNETKAEGEKLVLKSGLNACAIRPAGIFGPGDVQMIPTLRQTGRDGRYNVQIGDNMNLFDVTYVANVAHAHVLAALRLLDETTAKSVKGQAFFITNDSPVYFWSIPRTVWKLDGKYAKHKWVIPYSVGMAISYIGGAVMGALGKQMTLTPFRIKTICAVRYYDISKAKKLLGYKPIVDIERGLLLSMLYLKAEDERKEKSVTAKVEDKSEKVSEKNLNK